MFNHIAFPTLFFLISMLNACAKSDQPSGQGGENSTTDVEYYGFSQRVADSEIYSVKANGQEIKVFPTDEPHIAWLGAAEGISVKFEVRLRNGVIKNADVRPLGKKYDFKISADGSLVLDLKCYDRVSVEINGDIENPLFIFVNPIDKEKPSKNDPAVMYFEAGKIYEAGDIVLSDVCPEVYLEPGTYVKGNILGLNVPGVRIHGGGLLNSVRNPGSHDEEFYQKFGVALSGCENARLDDFTSIFAGAGWSSLYVNCHNSIITNLKALGLSDPAVERTVNNDSMDIIGGRNIRVSKCFLRGHDDAYCIKSQKFKLKGEVDGVWFEDCIGWNVGAGNTFEIGYESQIDIKNVHYKDIYAIHSGTSGTDLRRAALSIHNGAAGTVSDITYENAYIEDAQEFAVYLACLDHGYNLGYEEDGKTPLKYSPGRIRNVSYRNIHVMNVRPGKGGCVIRGYDEEHNVSGISFENFDYLGKKVTSLGDQVWKEATNCQEISFK